MNKTLYLNSAFETKAFKKGSKGLKIAGYANTIVKDRAGDVVTAEAWAKGVDNYRKNPVLLYQHKHDCPIGRVENIVVDKKGIHVEGVVSEAAEKTHGIQTLIKDGALKSFSVGFRVKWIQEGFGPCNVMKKETRSTECFRDNNEREIKSFKHFLNKS